MFLQNCSALTTKLQSRFHGEKKKNITARYYRQPSAVLWQVGLSVTNIRLPRMIAQDVEILGEGRKEQAKNEGFSFYSVIFIWSLMRNALPLPKNSSKGLTERRFMVIQRMLEVFMAQKCFSPPLLNIQLNLFCVCALCKCMEQQIRTTYPEQLQMAHCNIFLIWQNVARSMWP